MKELIIIILFVIIIISGIVIYKHYDNKKEEEITIEETTNSETDDKSVSQHFIKMFANVSPWPGISQASYKSKKGANDNEKIENNLVDDGNSKVFAKV